jgi:gas vesicle protein
MSTDPDQIRAQIERTRESLSDDVNALADGVNPKTVVRRQTRKMTGALGGVKDRVMGTASDATSGVGDTMHSLTDTAASAPAQVTRRTQGSPLAAGLIAFGAGLLAAALIPASEREQAIAEQVKEKAQPLMDEAKQVAQDTAQELKEPATSAVDAVKEKATDAAGTVKDEGQSAVADVRDDASAAKDTVAESRS